MNIITITDVRAMAGDSAFLLDDGKTSVLYDSGFAFTGSRVAENIKKVLKERKLDYIFLTHSHYDHALGSVYVKKLYPEAKIVAGEYATKIFEKPTAKAVMRDLDKKFALTCGVLEYEDLIDNLSVDIPVKDGDKIIAGDMAFTAVALPGHTKCSIGYYLEEEKLLLGSETLGVYTGTEKVLPSYLIGYRIALDSIAKVENLDIESILVPHYGLISGSEAQNYIKNGRINAENTAKEIVDILSKGGSDEDAIKFFLDKYYSGYAKEIYPIDAIELNTKIMVKLLKNELIENA
ncbi:MAG: MBL fold metallo-hydrolase [Clostridia bacterium]|nr:MBL fold metallo-hydrolase [Clostridia bacterium]